MAKAAKTTAVPSINIGISDKDRAAIAQGLSRLLADTYTLYLTTHNFHWNVTGPMFNTLHTMFMAQYTELWNAVDPIAERIRSLGHTAPGSYAQFGRLARVLLVLRIGADRAEGIEAVVLADRGVAVDHAVRADTCAFAEADMGADDRVGADLDRGVQFGGGVDDRGGMEAAHAARVRVWAAGIRRSCASCTSARPRWRVRR